MSDPTFEELDSSHSQAVWIRVVKREQDRRARECITRKKKEDLGHAQSN